MADKTFRLEIIAPDRIFYSNDIYMVEYNTAVSYTHLTLPTT